MLHTSRRPTEENEDFRVVNADLLRRTHRRPTCEGEDFARCVPLKGVHTSRRPTYESYGFRFANADLLRWTQRRPTCEGEDLRWCRPLKGCCEHHDAPLMNVRASLPTNALQCGETNRASSMKRRTSSLQTQQWLLPDGRSPIGENEGNWSLMET